MKYGIQKKDSTCTIAKPGLKSRWSFWMFSISSFNPLRISLKMDKNNKTSDITINNLLN